MTDAKLDGLEERGPGACPGLQWIFCSGEPLAAELVARCLEQLGVEIHNLYGALEASIDSSYWDCVWPPPVGEVLNSCSNH